MSLFPFSRDGYYDERGHWQRTKFCFVQCQRCTCGPPGGRYYAPEHDTTKKDSSLPTDAKP